MLAEARHESPATDVTAILTTIVELIDHLRNDAGVASGDSLRRRFTIAQLHALVDTAGLRRISSHGVRVFLDSAPDAVIDSAPEVLAELLAMEHLAASDPAYFGIAAALHVLAAKP